MPETTAVKCRDLPGATIRLNVSLATQRCSDLGANSLAERAVLMGVSLATYHRLVAGSHVPSTDTCNRVADALGLPVGDLFPWTPRESAAA